MTTSILVLSVPHTGTRFTQRLLSPYGDATAVHVTEPTDAIRAKVDAADMVVIPLRNPDDCWAGWIKRGKDKEHEFAGCWAMLQYWADEIPGAFLLPIDVDARDDALQNIADELAVSIETDWSPIGTEYSRRQPGPTPPLNGVVITDPYYA